MKHAFKKIMALLLAVAMIVGILPAVLAADELPFTDVKETDWFAPYVDYVYNHEPQLMNGMTEDTFEPHGTVTRAMAAVVLYRLADPVIPSIKPSTFTDLTADWYKNGIAWAQQNGVVNGVSEDKFEPDGFVTREQLVTMIWRYNDSPVVEKDYLKDFPDASKISDYAKEAFNWAISKGIISGSVNSDDTVTLNPQGNATRAEFAKIISVFNEVTKDCDGEHLWDEGVKTADPTCTEAGEILYTCVRCGETKSEELPAMGHSYHDGACYICGEALAADGDIVIYYTNDVHTYIDGALSYDTIADLKAQTKKVADGVLLVDAGDHIQGTAYGSMDKGETIIELMNAADYDLATLGNHEFDYGMERALELVGMAEYPYISANFYHEKDGVKGENVLDAYRMYEISGVKIAFVGITTPESFTKSTPAYFQDENGNYIYGISGGATGTALYADVQAAINAAKADGADYIIALGHLGDDPASQPWTSEELIANTIGLDAFIDGHSHSTVEGKEVSDKAGNPVLLTQTGEYFGAIGKMTINEDGISTELLTSYNGSDGTVAAIQDAWIAEIETKLGEVIGYAEVTFDNYDADGNRLVRKVETNTGDFAADALYYLFDNMGLDVDVAIMNGGGVRNKAITGEISYLTCKEIHTFGNVACLQTITGQQLLDALEWGARDTDAAECGGFLQVSGITYEVHTYIESTVQKDDKGVWTGGPTGEYRVKNVKILQDGEYVDLDLTASYNLAGYNYTLRDLGDGFAMFDGAVNVLDYVMEDYQVLANYVKSFAPDAEHDNLPTIQSDSVYAEVTGEGRITLVKEDPNGGSETPDNPDDPTPDDPTPAAGYVAIFNNAKGKVMTTETSSYTNSSGTTKIQMVSADATLNGDKLSTTATNVALFKMETVDGVTTFVTADGKYLSCDGTNMGLVAAKDDNCEFVLEETDGGYFIRLANFLFNGTSAQYIEFYANVFTCYGMGTDPSIYTFNFYELEGAETPDTPDDPDTPVTGNEYTLTSELKDGDKVVIYNAGSGNAVPAVAKGNYYLDVTAVTPTGNKIVTEDATLVWTATKNADGTYSFANGSNVLSINWNASTSKTSVTLDGANPKVTLESCNAENFSYYIYSATQTGTYGNIYLEYYAQYTEFSAYCTSADRINENAFGFQFYALGGSTGTTPDTPDEPDTPVTPDVPSDGYVAIYNAAKGKVMTTDTSTYTNSSGTTKIQMVSADATLNGDKLSTTATNVALFKMETVDGVTTFVTADGKYLSCDGTNMGLVDTKDDNCEFVLEETDGGYFIRLANFLFNGTSAQYIEFYANVFTCYGMGTDTSIYTFNFYEVETGSETPDEPDTPVEPGESLVFEKVTADQGDWAGTYVIGWDDGTNAVIFNGQTDANGNHVSSALTDNKVTVSADCAIVIEAVSGGYTLKASAGYLNGTVYNNAASNGLKFEETASVATITWENGNPIITSAEGTVFRYNNNSYDGADPYSWFRFFKPTSSVQTPVALYKLTGDTPVVPDEPDTPDTPDEPSIGNEYVLTNELKDGDKVVIYNAGSGNAVPAVAKGNYYLDVTAVTPTDNKIVTEDETIVWTVTKNADGTYSFTNGSNVLSINWNASTSKTSVTLDGTNPKVTLESCNAENFSYYIYSATQTGTYGNIYLEYYAQYTEFSAYCTSTDRINENAFGFQFYALGGETPDVPVTPDEPDTPVEPEDPETPVEGDTYVLTTELKDGDQLVIYYPAGAMVLGNTLDGNKVAGVAATVTDGTLVPPTGAAIYTVEFVDNTNFTLKMEDGSYLTTGETGNSMSFETAANDYSLWYLEVKAGTDIVYVRSTNAAYNGNANQALEYYSGFTTYGWKDSAYYEFQLFVKNDEAVCAHTWDAGVVTTEPGCTTEGVLTYTCGSCGKTKTETIAALGHQDNDGDDLCDNCGTVLGGDLVETAFEDIKPTDTVVIVISGPVSGKDYVMLNTASDSNRGAGAEFDAENLDETMFWNIVPCDGGYTIYKAGSTTEWLYLTNANNGVRVGSSTTGNVFNFGAPAEGENNYLYAAASDKTRYIGAYDNNKGDTAVTFNFRCYDSGMGSGNIAGQTTTFYVVGG